MEVNGKGIFAKVEFGPGTIFWLDCKTISFDFYIFVSYDIIISISISIMSG